MNREKLIAELKSLIQPYSQDLEALEKISEDTDFIKDLKINSANLVDIILDVEEAYKIEIDNESMEKMITVGAAVNIIEEKVNSHGRQ
jgi:acyl carrier protein